jgi:hypothetical protein
MDNKYYIILLFFVLFLMPQISKAGECQNWQGIHPEWIFCDDFEDNTALLRVGRYFDYYDADGSFTRVDGVGIDGSRGMRVAWLSGLVEAGNLKLAFGRNPVSSNGINTSIDYREIYYRMYLKLQSGWVGNPAKLSRATVFTASNWSQAMVAHIWDGATTHLKIEPVSCVNGNTVQCSGYNDMAHFKWIGSVDGATALFDGNHNNQWFCLEAHVKLNDPGQSNGVQEYWIDGTLDARSNGLNFVGSYTDYGINAIFFENYWNAGAPKAEERYFDNIVVSTQPIGCIDNSVPSSPLNLKIEKITP